MFVLDTARHSTKLDRNAKARLLHSCEVFERKTKASGRRNGTLGLCTVTVLRVLLTRFHNRVTGLCCPSIETLQDATGFCRATIVKAIGILERIGVLGVVRRLVRVLDVVTGLVMTRQGSNLYAFRELPALIPLPSSSAQPLKRKVFFGRVYGVDRNHINKSITTENTAPSSEEVRGFREEIAARPAPKDWKERARMSFNR